MALTDYTIYAGKNPRLVASVGAACVAILKLDFSKVRIGLGWHASDDGWRRHAWARTPTVPTFPPRAITLRSGDKQFALTTFTAPTMIVKGPPLNDYGYELRTRTDGKGDGVFATRTFEIDETAMVGVIDGTLDGNDSHATQVGRSSWVRHGGLGPKVNHSCSPNCGVRLNEAGACDFVARRRINSGDEITFDYAMRNYAIEHFPGVCLCGASTCRGAVTGWKDLSDDQKFAYDGQVMPYLLEIDRESEPVPQV